MKSATGKKPNIPFSDPRLSFFSDLRSFPTFSLQQLYFPHFLHLLMVPTFAFLSPADHTRRVKKFGHSLGKHCWGVSGLFLYLVAQCS